MKKLYIASGLVCLLAAATSCDKYDIYPEQYGKVMMIKDAGDRAVTVYATEESDPCYISVMKSGHSPENPAQGTVKILSDYEFGVYKEKYYGRKDFEGLVRLNPDFYYLADANGTRLPGGSLTHDFVDENDRYFGVNVMFDARKISDWIDGINADIDALLDAGKDTEDPEVKALRSLLNDYTYVVPVGLFSASDSVNADNQYVMVQPKVEYPTVSVNLASGAYQIAEISRALLRDEDGAFRNDNLEPDVTFSIPVKLNHGFGIGIKALSKNDGVDKFNSFHTDIVLQHLAKKTLTGTYAGETLYEMEDFVHFDPNQTEARLPLKIFRKFMDYDNLDGNFVVGVQLNKQGTKAGFEDPATGKKVNTDVKWDDPSQVDPKVQTSLKVPDSDSDKFASYSFFTGFRVVETPLELTADNVLYTNDCEPTEGSVEGLFDDDLDTFFHSTWSDPVYRTTPFGSYLDFEIVSNDPINAVAVQIYARVHSNPVSPKVIALYHTDKYNDDQPDASEWQIFSESSYTVTGLNGNAQDSGKVGWFGDVKKKWLKTKGGATIHYLRLCVLENTKGEDITTTGTSTSKYWNVAGMRIYGTYLNE